MIAFHFNLHKPPQTVKYKCQFRIIDYIKPKQDMVNAVQHNKELERHTFQ